MASAFSTALLADLGAISEAVSSSTTVIASSLGGAPVQIVVNGASIVAPAVDAGDGTVDVDTSGLEALTPAAAARFSSIEPALDQHLRALEGTDWEGNAKLGAVEQVSGFTRQAQSRTAEAPPAELDGLVNDGIARMLVLAAEDREGAEAVVFAHHDLGYLMVEQTEDPDRLEAMTVRSLDVWTIICSVAAEVCGA